MAGDSIAANAPITTEIQNTTPSPEEELKNLLEEASQIESELFGGDGAIALGKENSDTDFQKEIDTKLSKASKIGEKIRILTEIIDGIDYKIRGQAMLSANDLADSINNFNNNNAIIETLKKGQDTLNNIYIIKYIDEEIVRLTKDGSEINEWTTLLETYVKNQDYSMTTDKDEDIIDLAQRIAHNDTQELLIYKLTGGRNGFGNGFVQGYSSELSNYLIKTEDFEAYLKDPNTAISSESLDSPNIINSRALANYTKYLLSENGNDIISVVETLKEIMGEEKIVKLGELWRSDKNTIMQQIIIKSGNADFIEAIKNPGKLVTLAPDKNYLNAVLEMSSEEDAMKLVEYIEENINNDNFNTDLKGFLEVLESGACPKRLKFLEDIILTIINNKNSFSINKKYGDVTSSSNKINLAQNHTDVGFDLKTLLGDNNEPQNSSSVNLAENSIFPDDSNNKYELIFSNLDINNPEIIITELKELRMKEKHTDKELISYLLTKNKSFKVIDFVLTQLENSSGILSQCLEGGEVKELIEKSLVLKSTKLDSIADDIVGKLDSKNKEEKNTLKKGLQDIIDDFFKNETFCSSTLEQKIVIFLNENGVPIDKSILDLSLIANSIQESKVQLETNTTNQKALILGIEPTLDNINNIKLVEDKYGIDFSSTDYANNPLDYLLSKGIDKENATIIITYYSNSIIQNGKIAKLNEAQNRIEIKRNFSEETWNTYVQDLSNGMDAKEATKKAISKDNIEKGRDENYGLNNLDNNTKVSNQNNISYTSEAGVSLSILENSTEMKIGNKVVENISIKERQILMGDNEQAKENFINAFNFFNSTLNLPTIWKFRHDLSKSFNDVSINFDDDSLGKDELILFSNNIFKLLHGKNFNALDDIHEVEENFRDYTGESSMFESGDSPNSDLANKDRFMYDLRKSRVFDETNFNHDRVQKITNMGGMINYNDK